MNLLEIIQARLGEDKVEEMSRSLGENKEGTLSALGNAVPLIVGAMARNSQSPEGAQNLAGALDRDHDGSVLENLGGLIHNPDEGQGNGILRHVLGEKRPVAEQAVAERSGISMESAGKLLAIAAPIVMGMIGKKKREENLDSGGIAGMLAGLASNFGGGDSNSSGGSSSGIGSMVSGLLDRDGDGDVMDDIGGMIGGLLGR